MNAVEIEEAVSKLAEAPFDPAAFPYAFLEAFGNKPTTIKRLKSGSSNQSDLPGGVLQRSNIHLAVCSDGQVTATLDALRESPATARHKAKFILATDGHTIEAENLLDGNTLACDFADLGDKFGFFLPLAGITTVKQIAENAFDIRATGRLNRLYLELRKTNPDWDAADRREALNHFFARLIFCFFAEDTGIFHSGTLFTSTVEQMTASDSSNTHEVIAELFRSMNTPLEKRDAAGFRPWAGGFPYVNGGLFSQSLDVPRFSKIARSYLLHIGKLDWKQINPDIFGSMIQAVAEDEERSHLGLHYTSVPNILKVLNPLFLDDLRAKLAEATNDDTSPKRKRGEETSPTRQRGTEDTSLKRERRTPDTALTPGSARKLLNLRNRIARIRVFDPACGSGNFLVIAYKEMRAIEFEINRLRGEPDRTSDIPLTNFRGIEIRSFPAEIARLALIIAEYQCDVLYRGQKLALAEFLPLEAANWITCGNALRLDWLKICPPKGTGVKVRADDLFSTPLDQAAIDFENANGATYICGNPPYVGDKKQNKEQKADIRDIFESVTSSWRSLDYICGFIYKAYQYLHAENAICGLVSTNSVVQGQHVPRFWGLIINDIELCFAASSFKWSNLASNKAGVTCVILGFSRKGERKTKLLYHDESVREVPSISPYLTAGAATIVDPVNRSISGLPRMTLGNVPKDDGGLLLQPPELARLGLTPKQKQHWTRFALGSTEFIQGKVRYCLWISDKDLEKATSIEAIRERIEHVRRFRQNSVDPGMAVMARKPHQFREMNAPVKMAIVVPRVSSEAREFLPSGLFGPDTVITDRNYAIYDEPMWCMSLITSRLHCVWIGTVCVRMRTDFSYSNTLGWNTFPVPALTDQNKSELTRCAENILLAREAHFPSTLAALYDPDLMPDNLRAAHDRNDETLERIYIGRRFKNDTERLEKLFVMYTQMTAAEAAKPPAKKPPKRQPKPPKG